MTSTGFCKHHANLTTERVAQHQRNSIHSTLCLHAPNLPYACDIETPLRLLEPHQMNAGKRIKKKNSKRCTPEPDDSQWGPNESSQNRCTYPSVKQSISALTSLQSVSAWHRRKVEYCKLQKQIHFISRCPTLNFFNLIA